MVTLDVGGVITNVESGGDEVLFWVAITKCRVLAVRMMFVWMMSWWRIRGCNGGKGSGGDSNDAMESDSGVIIDIDSSSGNCDDGDDDNGNGNSCGNNYDKVLAREVVVVLVNRTKGRKERTKSWNVLKDVHFIGFPPFRNVTYSLLRRDSNSHDAWECDSDENIPRIVVRAYAKQEFFGWNLKFTNGDSGIPNANAN